VLATFAIDHDGLYPEAKEHLPDYYSEPSIAWEQTRRYRLDSYVSSFKILSCPFHSHTIMKLHEFSPPDLHWRREWDRKDTGTRYCHMNYMWTGNHQREIWRYYNGEPPWPDTLHESTSDRTLITHRINLISGQHAGQFVGHAFEFHVPGIRSRGEFTQEDYETAGLVENPVGFADGHVEVRQPKDIKRRVLTTCCGLLHY
jgi:hypothetical protein